MSPVLAGSPHCAGVLAQQPGRDDTGLSVLSALDQPCPPGGTCHQYPTDSGGSLCWEAGAIKEGFLEEVGLVPSVDLDGQLGGRWAKNWSGGEQCASEDSESAASAACKGAGGQGHTCKSPISMTLHLICLLAAKWLLFSPLAAGLPYPDFPWPTESLCGPTPAPTQTHCVRNTGLGSSNLDFNKPARGG